MRSPCSSRCASVITHSHTHAKTHTLLHLEEGMRVISALYCLLHIKS